MFDIRKTEKDVLSFWKDNDIFEKSLRARDKAKRFVFFEGPPTANGRPGIHHFLGRAFKDLFCRYKTMRGFFVLRKAGWDTHGLPVEIEVEKELGFKTKKDIDDYGVAEFNKKAKESVWKYKQEWEEMTRRMGFWVNMNDPYITYESDYIESLWYIIQQIWEKKLLYLAHKVVPFCTRCGTSLSSHEVAQGYKRVTDESVYIKFKLKAESLKTKARESGSLSALDLERSAVYILAWTTTPWTLPGNVALAVGKDIDYVIVEKNKENYILAKDLIEKVFGSATSHKPQTISYKGSDLIGLEYEPIFDIPELRSPASYKVYEADFVSTEEGTGIVHTAVMYGEDDYVLGTKVNLPKHHTVDEQGKFVGVNKELDGKYVKSKETENSILAYLENKKYVLKTEPHEHDYPFCWRCDSPLLYYAKNSWFIKMSAVRSQILKNNQKINWIPEHIKEGRFGQWLKEGKDWAFSRERYWGTPLPIWKCQKCDNYKVIGSVAEMEKLATGAMTQKNHYYTLRHGLTTRDERGKGIISSELDADKYHLTEEGIKQVENMAEIIKNNHKIDLIFSSPFLRTKETAEITAKVLHLNVQHDQRLVEVKHGGCEGKPHFDCPSRDTKQNMDDKHHDIGESWNEVRKRMMDFMTEIDKKYFNKNILMISHGDPLWLLRSIGLGQTGKEILEGGRNYPDVAEFEKIEWRILPRNKYGELDLHRPFVDEVVLKCKECDASLKKIPDLIDVWFDSGAMPFAQWHWPFDSQGSLRAGPSDYTQGKPSKKIFKDQFPADFIVEGVDQTRGWFYTLLAVSTLLGKGNPYKNVMSLGHVLDEKGKKMSKSKGNMISPFEVMDKVGADTARWYFYTLNQPGEYKNFSIKDVESKLKGFIFTLQNCVRFYELYAQGLTTKDQSQIPHALDFKFSISSLLDKWIVSKLNGLIAEVSGSLDIYDPTTAARAIERFVIEDFSNWWLRRSRKRKESLGLLRVLLLEIAKIIAPFSPFIAEDIYGRLHQGVGLQGGYESVHLADWPKPDKEMINRKLEEEMEELRSIVAAGLAIRKEKQIKVRQPLAKMSLRQRQATNDKEQEELNELIKDELNVKDIVFDKNQKEEVVLDTELSLKLINEGYARELIRQIQDMRKEAGYRLDAKVFGQWHSDDSDLSTAIHQWTEEIKKETLLKKFVAGPHDKKAYDVEKEFSAEGGPASGGETKKIWVGVRK